VVLESSMLFKLVFQEGKYKKMCNKLLCVAILAAFMGPSKAAPLIRSIELHESHFEHGAGVLNAVQARLSRR
jgi:hypothetical protein